MTDHSREFQRCLETLDVAAGRKLWEHVFPHYPPPGSDHALLVTMHMARTQSKTIKFKFRAYSHRWLTERSLPSQLPDNMRPHAERVKPRIVDAVGISVRSLSQAPGAKEAAAKVQRAMENAVLSAYADGVHDPDIVKQLMSEARTKEHKKLYG